MQLHPALTGERIIEPAGAAASEAKLTQPFAAKCLDRLARVVETGQFVDHWKEIEDGLGMNARNRRRSDVVNYYDSATQLFQQTRRFLLSSASPGRIVRPEVDRKARHVRWLRNKHGRPDGLAGLDGAVGLGHFLERHFPRHRRPHLA